MSAGLQAAGPPEHRLHPLDQLLDRERLGDVVVDAEAQALHLVGRAVAGGQEDDGHLRAALLVLAEAAGHGRSRRGRGASRRARSGPAGAPPPPPAPARPVAARSTSNPCIPRPMASSSVMCSSSSTASTSGLERAGSGTADPGSRAASGRAATTLRSVRAAGRFTRSSPVTPGWYRGNAAGSRRILECMSTITLPEPSATDPLPPPPPSAPEAPGTAAAGAAAPPASRLRRLVRGREADPAWVRPSVLGLLAATAVLYLWGLGASGWANSFYSAAVQAGTQSWKAFFFGSSDAANFITVDKPPAVAVADGAVGAHLRPQLLEHPRARGAGRRGVGRASSTPRCGGGSHRPPASSPAPCWR